jgi:hypothetical protein
MWCRVLCFAGGSLPSVLATSWNWLKICLKTGGVASTAAKRPLLDGGGASVAAGGPAANLRIVLVSSSWLAARSTTR